MKTFLVNVQVQVKFEVEANSFTEAHDLICEKFGGICVPEFTDDEVKGIIEDMTLLDVVDITKT